MSLQITEEQISKWPPDAQAVVRLLMAEVAELRREVTELKRRLAEFEGPKTPQNSSLPPSSQHPHAARPKRPKSKRKRGGQPGHRKYDRALIPTADCDETKTLKPTACRRCGTQLSGSDSAPLRHQVWELPEIRPLVTEYQRHRLTCPCCSETTCAALPSGVPTGQSGPRLVAFSGLLMAYFRQSKRRAALFLEDLLDQPCCPALTVKMQNQVSEALAEPYRELEPALADLGSPATQHPGVDRTPRQTSETIGTRSDEAGHRDVPTLARIPCRHDLTAHISPPYGTGA